MDTDTPDTAPNPTPTPVTIERVADLLKGQGLNFFLDQPVKDKPTVLRTGFIDTEIFMVVDGPYLVFDARWRGQPDKKDAPKLLAMCNEWNLKQITPVMRFQELAQEDSLVLMASRIIAVEAGLNDQQLIGFLLTSIQSLGLAWQYATDMLPDYVTWGEELEKLQAEAEEKLSAAEAAHESRQAEAQKEN